MPEHARVVAVATRMRHALVDLPHATVARDHRERLLHDALHVVFTHAVIDHARAARFVHLEHLFDLAGDVALLLNLFRDLSNRLAVERLVRAVRSYDRKRVVFETTPLQRILRVVDRTFARCLISQSFLCFIEATSAQPRWQSRIERRRARGVRVLIDSDDESARSSFAHEAERHRTLTPELLVADLEMRDLDRQSGL